ncbi:MAG: 4-(cytidine 5'-diphospho)-2-C-methyl-D-erythritol kinase [Oscillospiraceae bacterium]|nr:4-(cytidine 5'-diphospho)-2-C-methyl-D-erythritol kinase [Oscillospiraceae bacterium]
MGIQVLAFGKLNLSLDVIRRQASGYHDMKMVMETVELCDDISIEVSEGTGIELTTNLPFLPMDGQNLAVRAAEVFFRELNLPPKRVTIRIFKRIPVSAGLAGGSSNAAAVLRGLNELLGMGLSREELMPMALLLGSDVPYCVVGGTVLAEGRGEILTSLDPLPGCHIVICKPNFSISTPSLFQRIDCGKIRHRPDTAGICEALRAGALDQVAVRLYNVFEDVLDGRAKEIMAIKRALIDAGALGAAMSGTGPSVFGLFDDEALAREAHLRLSKSYRETFLTRNRRETLI